MKIVSTLFVFGLLFFATTGYINAQVVINEIHPGEEWVELYNIESSEVNLEGYTLSMGSDSQKITFTSSDVIPINGFKVIGQGMTPGWGSSSNWLNNDGDTVSFTKPDTSVESITYGSSGVCKPGDGKSVGRYPDANNTVERFGTPTKGASNVFDLATSCNPPTATPTPSPTPTPTPSKTPSPTPTPTKTPSPTPTKSPTPKPQPKADRPLDETSEPIVLTTSTEEPEASDAPEVKETENKFPVLAIPLMGIGAGFVGVAAYPIIKNRFKGYNN